MRSLPTIRPANWRNSANRAEAVAETLSQAIARIRRELTEAGIDDAAREARLLLGGLLDLEGTAFITGGERVLRDDEMALVADAVRRRMKREPVYRILGRRPFFRLVLALSPDTLEPRPDTEILVERLIPMAEAVVALKGTCRVLDLGTGTGAIALALADMVPGVMATGADLSAGALETAMRNAHVHEIQDRFVTVQSDWFSAIDGRFDIVVSNPPYISSAVVDALDDEVRHFDPRLALDGGADGLDAYRAIAGGAREHLTDGGVVAFEIGYDQRADVTALMSAHGFHLLEASKDLAGQDRVLIFQPV